MEFHLSSYESHQHIEHESKPIGTWKNDSTVNPWRHRRMYNHLDPVIEAYPDSKWLTVGDGRMDKIEKNHCYIPPGMILRVIACIPFQV